MATKIPNKISKFQFIKINHVVSDPKDLTAQKRPMENDWPYQNNYKATDKNFINYLSRAKRYGVLCGVNDLIVIDFDNKEVQDMILSKNQLPETFTVKSAGKGLYHLYYKTDFAESWKAFSEQGATLFDVQGQGHYVLGPNSQLDNDKLYEVIKDIDVAFISHKDLGEIFKDYIKISASKKSLEKKGVLNKETDVFIDEVCAEIKEKLSIHEALKEFGIDTTKNPCMCPLGHPSIHAASFSYEFDDDKMLWKCHHCLKAGDVITLYQEKNSWDFKTTKQELMKKLGIKEINAGLKIDVTSDEIISDKEYELNMKIVSDKVIEKKMFTPTALYAACLLMNKRFIFATRMETDAVYYYKDDLGIYKPDAEAIIKSELELHFKHQVTKHIISEAVARIQRLTMHSTSEFNAQDRMLCLRNGVYDLNTKTLLPHSYKYLFLNRLNVIYNKDATCPLINKFLSEIVDEGKKEMLYEILGFCLFPTYKIQKAIILYGIGANGKSVYLEVIRRLLGRENVSSEPLQKLTKDKFSAHELYGKLANIYADLSSQEIADASTFKILTSGLESLDAEQKFKNPFQFINRAKLLFSCNRIPPTKENSDAFFRRWIIIIFPFKFIGIQADKDLISKLCIDEEISGLFNVALEKYYIMEELGDFSFVDDIEVVRDLYTRLSNPVVTFLDEVVTIDPLSYIVKKKLYDKYTDYCFNRKIPAVGFHEFLDSVKERFKVSDYLALEVDKDGKNIRASSFRGIAWVDDVENIITQKKEMNLGDFDLS